MSADTLLRRLDGVKARGRGNWIARCPAHEDRSPSLSVRELEAGARDALAQFMEIYRDGQNAGGMT